MGRLGFVFLLAAGFMIVSQSPWLTRSEPIQPWGNSGGDSLQPMATTVYPWPMYTYNETHASATKSPSPDDASVYWWNSTGPTMYGSPTIAEGKVFIGMGSGTGDSMMAFHINNGTRAWRTTTQAQVSGGTGVSSTPAYSNGLLFFGADKLYALYASNGTVKWTYNVPNTLWGSGTPTVAQGKVFIGGADRWLYVLDQLTGSLVWRFQTLSTGASNFGLYSPPSIWNNYVYLAGCDGYVYQINITQPGPTASYYHRSPRFMTMYGSPLIFDGKVYIGDGYTGPDANARFRALSATDLGVVWTFTPPIAGTFFSSAAVAYNKIFVGSTNGYVYALDPWTNAIIWRYNTGGVIWSSPAISDGKVFIGSDSNNLYSFNANQTDPASTRWAFSTGGNVNSAPAISDGRVCVGTWGGGGRIYCVGSGIAPPVNNPPFISLTYPSGSQDWTGGSSQTITWTMTDDVTPIANLRVYLNYTSTPSSGTIAGPLTGATSRAWTVPMIDANDVRVNATVIDEKGLKGYSDVLVPKVDSTRPIVVSASPTGTAVPLTVPLIVNFSETMDRASVESSFTLAPNPGSLTYSWSQRVFPDDTMTVNHLAFSGGTLYTATVGIGSKDVSSPGNFLASDYAWTFTTISLNQPPSISVTLPMGGESWTGGSVHNVDWIAGDTEDPLGNLRIWINYSVTGGAPYDRQIPGIQGLAGDARPYVWMVSIEDSASVVLQATVIDTAGASGNGLSPMFEIDSTPPAISSTSPAAGEIGVPMSANVIAMWSEAMNTISAQSAFSLKDTTTWTSVAGTFSWAGDIMTFDPSALLSPSTQYSANFTTLALDDSQPGNALAATYTWTFTTAMVSDVTRPTLMAATAIPDPQEVYLPVNVSVVVQDDVAVGLVRLFVTDPISGTSNVTMSYDPVQGRYYLTRGYNRLGTYTFDIWASDTSGNWNSTSGQFVIEDRTPPAISDLLASPSPVHILSQTNLSATVTDNYQLAGVWVEVTAPDMTSNNQTMSPGAKFYFNTAANQLGTYSYEVSAVDSSGNWNTATGTFNCVDLVPPVIEHTATPSYLITRIINITANVTDNTQVQEVRLAYYDTTGTSHNVTMIHSQQNVYYFGLPTQPQTGTLTYSFWATDQSANDATSPVYSSQVIEMKPDLPGSLTAVPEDCGALRLQWIPPTTNEDGSALADLAGYNVYRSTLPGVQGTRVNTPLVQVATYLDSGLENGFTYHYMVRGVNSRGVESEHSNEAQATTLASCGSTGPGDNDRFPLLTVVILLIVILVVVCLLLIILMKRRKKEGAEQEEKGAPRSVSDKDGKGKAK